ncbi:MAG: T9SS type A sorting domain-containing protein [Bacteroidia bacterium]|nr:T9SS type A sorting domain-containing protein [Bacteroidia bacterium]
MKRNLIFLLFIACIVAFPSNELMAQPTLVGMTISGGEDFGLMFKTNDSGENFKVKHVFEGHKGAFPFYGQLCEASNGLLYGLTSQGGKYNLGVLFVYDPMKDSMDVLVEFDGTNLGSNPRGSLMRATNGLLYGMTNQGGANNYGTLFMFNTSTGIITKNVDFNGSLNGRNPVGQLTEASNNKFYGMTYQGGTYDEGSVFEYNPSNDSLIIRWHFDGTTGRNPFGGFAVGSNGLLYGMTYQGGSNNLGVLFEYNPSTFSYTKKLDFNGTATGSNPYSTFTQGPTGLLYAMTYLGGANNLGTLISYDVSQDTLVKIIDFTGGVAGRNPLGNLSWHSNGKCYGLMPNGGNANAGFLFEFNPLNDSLKVIHNVPGGVQGRNPFGSLTLASNGHFYAMTYQGGLSNSGTLFEYQLSAQSYTKKVDFNYAEDGGIPFGNLLFTSSHQLYGMTYQGGLNNAGVIFSYNPVDKSFNKVFNFSAALFGKNPYGGLIELPDGKLMGMTSQGGANDYGTLFSFDTSQDSCTKLIDFDGTNGRQPYGNLMLANNSKLYGLTPYGGKDDYGVLFEFDASNNAVNVLVDFDNTTNGSSPFGNLIQSQNGKLYGMTNQGGNSDYGVLFEYDLSTSTYSKIIDFDGANTGSYPLGNLIEVDNGKMYGMTQYGGANNRGVIFEFDPSTQTFLKVFDFIDSMGINPAGSLELSFNQRLYGITQTGGKNNEGTLFEYDYNSQICNKKFDFGGEFGSKPYSSLTKYCIPSYSNLLQTNCDSLISPSGRYTWKQTGLYLDTIKNSKGCDSFMSIYVTILKSSKENLIVSTCDSFVAPDGSVHKSSKNFSVIIPNSVGCDSTISIDLTINNSYDSLKVESCFSYTAPDQQVYTESGWYTAVIPNTKGCDSTISIELTINKIDLTVINSDTTLTAAEIGAAYQWLDCEDNYSEIPNATNALFEPSVNGDYAVEIQKNNCFDTSICYSINQLSLETIVGLNAFRIYPNPVLDILHIDIAKEVQSIRITITNMQGQIILSTNYNGTNNIQIPVDFASGIYFIHVQADEESLIYKFNKS